MFGGVYIDGDERRAVDADGGIVCACCTVKASVSVSESVGLVTVTSLDPVTALASMLMLTVTCVGLFTVMELMVMPAPKSAALTLLSCEPVITISRVWS